MSSRQVGFLQSVFPLPPFSVPPSAPLSVSMLSEPYSLSVVGSSSSSQFTAVSSSWPQPTSSVGGAHNEGERNWAYAAMACTERYMVVWQK